MRRYWISKDALNGDEVRLTGDELHHIRDVCRMRMGSRFEVLVEGRAHLVEIVGESKHESVARVLESRTVAALPEPHVHLVLAVPRFPVFEAVLEKAVELGVKTVHPVFSEFSFIRKQDDVFAKKLPRWLKIVQGATQQTGRGELMEIAPVASLEAVLKTFNRNDKARGLFAYEGEGQLSLKDALAGIRASGPSSVWVFVGSEGGFSDREVQLFKDQGLEPVTLGTQVLRVETACVALVSIIKYDLGQMQSDSRF